VNMVSAVEIIIDFLKRRITALEEFWLEFRRYRIGVVGLIMFFILLCMAIAANIVVPPDIRYNWATNPRWAFNPKLAPPAWINMFSDKKYLEPTDLYPIEKPPLEAYREFCVELFKQQYSEQLARYTEEQKRKIIEYFRKLCSRQQGLYYEFHFNNRWDIVGKDMMLIIENLRYPVDVVLYIYRPDNIVLENIDLGSVSPTNLTYLKLQYSEAVAKAIVEELVRPVDGDEAARKLAEDFKIKAVSTIPFIFAVAKKGISLLTTGTLKGEYTFVVVLTPIDKSINISEYPEPRIRIRLLGACYGLLGTDAQGRDNFVTILLGSQLALLLGFTYSVAAVLIGVVYGSLSGYFRGIGKIWLDEALQRVNEVVYALPILPFLILFSYYLRMVYKIQPNIWHIAGMLLIFGWTGVALVARSMALSIMGQPYIEAATAIGASGIRILFRYVLPQIVPYAFASIALSIPTAVLMEAGLSFLGLTDPNMPSWGRMLYEAQSAIVAWWWVIPPGLMITFTAATFAFIGTALDAIVNPRLRRV